MMGITSISEHLVASGYHVYMIPADYAKCNFSKLLEESRQHGNNGSVTWRSISSAREGDIVYFYYKNLPSANVKAQRRILMRGVVTESEHLVSRDLVENCDSKELVKGIRIGQLRPIALQDERKFSLDVLKTKYNLKTERKQQLKENNRELFEDLEEEASKGEQLSLEDLSDYFQTSCFC